MTSNPATVRREHARYGAATQQEFDGPLPQPFPREIGPRAMEYLAEVVDSGLTCDMVGRFEQAFAEAHGVAHCIATPGCTPALAVLAAAFGFEPGRRNRSQFGQRLRHRAGPDQRRLHPRIRRRRHPAPSTSMPRPLRRASPSARGRS